MQQNSCPQISGSSHSFDTGIAKNLGVNAAIVYNHILYWVKHNKIKNQGMHDGRAWMYESVKDMADFLGYFTERQVRYAIDALCDAGLLEKSHHSNNKFDRVTWYTVCQMHLTNLSNGTYTNGKSDLPPMANVYMNNNKHKEQEEGMRTSTSSCSPEAPFFSFELRKFEGISDQDIESWKDAYPSIDVKKELSQMKEWCLSNDSKCRNKRNWRKFITSWLSNENDKTENRASFWNKQGSVDTNVPSIQENVQIAKETAKFYKSKHYTIEVLSKEVEIVPKIGYGSVESVKFSEKGFKDQLESLLRKKEFEKIS